MNKQQLYAILLEDPRRQVQVNGRASNCEGQAYRPHVCKWPLDMNEVLITKRVFQRLSKKNKGYFLHEYNCSLNCRFFHSQFGHSRGFREWFLDHVISIYGKTSVDNWIEKMPLKIRRIEWLGPRLTTALTHTSSLS